MLSAALIAAAAALAAAIDAVAALSAIVAAGAAVGAAVRAAVRRGVRHGKVPRGGRRRALAVMLASGLLASGLLVGCGATTDGQVREVSAKALEVRERMHQRFTATRQLELAIAFGRLDAAQTEAGAIAGLAEPDMLPEWQPYVEQIRAAAREIQQAPNLVAAANLSAMLGQRCARCHAVSAARLTFAEEDRPGGSARLPAHMASHQWATTRLWEGLVGPSPERWLAGARALADAPLAIVAEGDNVPPDLAVSDDVSRIRLYANRALAAASPDDRAGLYGQLLATCVRCHAKIRDR